MCKLRRRTRASASDSAPWHATVAAHAHTLESRERTRARDCPSAMALDCCVLFRCRHRPFLSSSCSERHAAVIARVRERTTKMPAVIAVAIVDRFLFTKKRPRDVAATAAATATRIAALPHGHRRAAEKIGRRARARAMVNGCKASGDGGGDEVRARAYVRVNAAFTLPSRFFLALSGVCARSKRRAPKRARAHVQS